MVVFIKEEEGERSENEDDVLSVVVVKDKPRRPPHNYMGIVKEAFRPFDTSSLEKICEQLYNGKYWVDRESNKNCFMVLARDLSITWGGDPQYWRWIGYNESDDEEEIEVAVLLSVCWLEIIGKFPTIRLAPGTAYEVAFKAMMLDSSFGWSFPVKISATLPSGKKEEHEEFIGRYPKNLWVDIPICEFTMSPENVGEVAFSMDEHDGGKWKHGMAVMGVSFCPKE